MLSSSSLGLRHFGVGGVVVGMDIGVRSGSKFEFEKFDKFDFVAGNGVNVFDELAREQ